jgi:Na+-driven multidrug efflux pump
LPTAAPGVCLMQASRRIVVNTLATYTRSLVAVGLALFSSRWVLSALGDTDFGLFNVVGSMIVFVTLANTVLADSAARHFAYAMGQGDAADVNRWFNAALGNHVCMAAALVLLGWPLGESLIRHVLTVPPVEIRRRCCRGCGSVPRLGALAVWVGSN